MPQKYDLKFSPRLLYLLTSVIIIHFSSSFHPCLHCFSICFLRISAVVAWQETSIRHMDFSLFYIRSICVLRVFPLVALYSHLSQGYLTPSSLSYLLQEYLNPFIFLLVSLWQQVAIKKDILHCSDLNKL